MDELKHSGVYYILYVNCNTESAGTVVISGYTQWINPFGHLPADEYWKVDRYLFYNKPKLMLPRPWPHLVQMWFFLVMTMFWLIPV